MKTAEWKRLGIFLISLILIVAVLNVVSYVFTSRHVIVATGIDVIETAASTTLVIDEPLVPVKRVATHVQTPESVRAVYMTSWVAGVPELRNKIVDLIKTTELNSVVIDIKDYTGRISFPVKNPELAAFGSAERRISDVQDFIDMLHAENIYVIGRLSVFQDEYMVKHKPEWAVKTKAGKVWEDDKGVSWIDVSARPFWDYIMLVAHESYDVGFDEINFDYIRFPSDGNMKDIAYPYTSASTTKSAALTEFFEFIRAELGDTGMVLSADLFGMTTTNYDDLGIGQLLEPALRNFDYIGPMVYPSHYPTKFMGFSNPSAKPYEVVAHSMKVAVDRANAIGVSPLKLRPWLQDFSINGTAYTPAMVRAQIQATYDVGLTGWMLWNASSRYTKSALFESEEPITRSASSTVR